MVMGRWIVLFLVALTGLTAPGCDGVESNYDLYWWKKPKRLVRPDPTARATPPDAGPSEPAASEASANPTTEPVEETVAEAPEQPAVSRPYYHLYLLSPVAESQDIRGASIVRLQRVHSARNLARIVEWLYPPLGRSGSDEATYLIYEQREEFEAALRTAPLLDVDSSDDALVSAGDAAFSTGVSQVLRVLEAGAVVPDELLEAALHNLSSAETLERLAPRQRWAAGILAGRLLAEYRYDYAGALKHSAAAARQMPPESIEAMTAAWWTVDALRSEGKQRETAEACEDLLDRFTHLWPRSYVISRSSALSKKLRAR